MNTKALTSLALASLLATSVLAGTALAAGDQRRTAAVLQGSGATFLQSVVPAVSTSSADEQFRAAAEPFETLTEISPTAALPTVDRTIDEAETAARGVRGLLPNGLSHQLDAQLAAVRSARRKHDRVELTLASIEAYRVLVSAVTTGAKVPTAVNLLDYAGFRYNVDLAAKPVRWGDMAQAVSFARGQWEGLPPMARSSPIRAIQFCRSGLGVSGGEVT